MKIKYNNFKTWALNAVLFIAFGMMLNVCLFIDEAEIISFWKQVFGA